MLRVQFLMMKIELLLEGTIAQLEYLVYEC
jgi:hypothetical protein